MPETFAGLSLDEPIVMGIINVTPDSFSDGGETAAHSAAITRGREMLAAGARILDVGGESTRPGAPPVSIAAELARVVPVIEALRDTDAVISIDTRHPEVMAAAVEAGAGVINDVTALSHDPQSVTVAADLGVPVILMHMQGEPGTMQANPHYDDAPLEVRNYLKERIDVCLAAGILASQIAVDPGIGFGKSVDHNLQILNRIDLLMGLGCPVVLGVSRKSFIGKVAGGDHPQDRLAGSLSCAVAARAEDVGIYRVHDVAETVQALKVFDAILSASS